MLLGAGKFVVPGGTVPLGEVVMPWLPGRAPLGEVGKFVVPGRTMPSGEVVTPWLLGTVPLGEL